MKILKGLLTSRLKKLKRHSHDILPHLTLRKILNSLRVEYEFRRGKTLVKGKPYWLKVETSRVCNLRCPGCYAHGREQDESYPDKMDGKRFMSLDMFKKIISEVKCHVFAVQLYDEGEPLLNPEIYDIISFAHSHNVGTMVSSNFSMPLTEDDFRQLVLSGLDHIAVDIDGITQEIYEKTRVNGNLERVIDNTKRLIAMKRRLKRRRPKVEIQFVQKPFNVHEMAHVEALSRELGADMFTPVMLRAFWVDDAPAPVPVPVPAPPPPSLPSKQCPIPWSSMVVQWNGDMTVCPLSDSTDLDTSFNVSHTELKTAFNSDFYLGLRDQHIHTGDASKVRVPICVNCDFRR